MYYIIRHGNRQSFNLNKLNTEIIIKGTDSDPLFRAIDIGKILGISNIRQTIKDFDNSERTEINTLDVIGRNQKTTFLTEKGLYNILFSSRKEIVKTFKNWMFEVVKEIRLTSEYTLNKKIQELENIVEQKKLEMVKGKEELENIIDQKTLEGAKAKEELENKKIQLDQKTIEGTKIKEELENIIDQKTFEGTKVKEELENIIDQKTIEGTKVKEELENIIDQKTFEGTKVKEELENIIDQKTIEGTKVKEELEIKNSQLKELEIKNKKISKYLTRKFENKYREGNCLYFIKSSEINDKFKVGMTVNIQTRLQDLNTASPCQFEILELYYTNFNSLIEKTLKEVFAVDRISVKCEWYDFSAIEKMKIFVKTHIEFLDTYKTNPLLQKIDGPEQTNLFPVDNLCMYTSKKCLECKQIFNFKFFFKNPPIGGTTKQTESDPSGPKSINLQDRCMSCYEKEHGPSKQCSTCKEIKHVHNFVIDKTKKDGLTYDCKFCRKLSIEKIKDNFTQKNPNNGKKICGKCENMIF
jgi:prophage antirepressor-like protein